MNARDAQPARISRHERDQAQELPAGSLHLLLAADPALWLAILRGSRDWKQGRVCSQVWVASKQYKAGVWATME